MFSPPRFFLFNFTQLRPSTIRCRLFLFAKKSCSPPLHTTNGQEIRPFSQRDYALPLFTSFFSRLPFLLPQLASLPRLTRNPRRRKDTPRCLYPSRISANHSPPRGEPPFQDLFFKNPCPLLLEPGNFVGHSLFFFTLCVSLPSLFFSSPFVVFSLLSRRFSTPFHVKVLSAIFVVLFFSTPSTLFFHCALSSSFPKEVSHFSFFFWWILLLFFGGKTR